MELAHAIERVLTNRNERDHIIVPIMGGDGTTALLIDQLLAQSELIGKNIHLIAFVPLPFGTGNDIGVSLGWGSKENEKTWAESIHSIAHAVCSENYDPFTIWDVEIFGDAEVQVPATKVCSNSKQVLVNQNGNNLKRKLACYLNMGLDA